MSSPDRPATPARAVFRQPWSALAIPLLVFMITTPLATALPILNLLFLLPLVALIYVLWVRTVVDAQHLTVYSLRGRRQLPWAELDGLEFRGPRWATAVTLSGDRFRLPMIRPRDLPRLASVSGGRLLLGDDSPGMQPLPSAEDVPATADPTTDLTKSPVHEASDQQNPAVEDGQAQVSFTANAQVSITGRGTGGPQGNSSSE